MKDTLCFSLFLLFVSFHLQAEPVTCTPKAPSARGKKIYLKDLKRARQRQPKADIVFLGHTIWSHWRTKPENMASWKKTFAGNKTFDLSHAGETTQILLWKLTEGKALKDLKPKVIFLDIGGGSRSSPEDVVAGIKKVIQTIQKQLPQCTVYLTSLIPRGKKDGKYWIATEKINEGISPFDKLKNVDFLDISKVLNNPDGTQITGAFQKNSYQLTPKGYELLSVLIRKHLK